jgi:hypothetical protein
LALAIWLIIAKQLTISRTTIDCREEKYYTLSSEQLEDLGEALPEFEAIAGLEA